MFGQRFVVRFLGGVRRAFCGLKFEQFGHEQNDELWNERNEPAYYYYYLTIIYNRTPPFVVSVRTGAHYRVHGVTVTTLRCRTPPCLECCWTFRTRSYVVRWKNVARRRRPARSDVRFCLEDRWRRNRTEYRAGNKICADERKRRRYHIDERDDIYIYIFTCIVRSRPTRSFSRPRLRSGSARRGTPRVRRPRWTSRRRFERLQGGEGLLVVVAVTVTRKTIGGGGDDQRTRRHRNALARPDAAAVDRCLAPEQWRHAIESVGRPRHGWENRVLCSRCARTANV